MLAIVLVALQLAWTPLPCAASEEAGNKVDAVWASYQRHWESIGSFTASFKQRIEVAGIGGDVESAGTLFFRKPDRLRWNYVEGPPQSVIGDGHWIWIYQPDLAQAYRVDYRAAFGSGGLVGLLADRSGLADRYSFALLDAPPGMVRLQLTPVAGAGETLDLTLAADTFDLREVVVHDPAGSVTYLEFSDVHDNVALADDLFVFTPPDGVDIITNPAD